MGCFAPSETMNQPAPPMAGVHGGWRMTMERTKQQFGVVDKSINFRPTSNARNNAMLAEAKVFSKSLRLLHKDLCEWDRSVTNGLITMKTVLLTPLPRKYADAPAGAFITDKEERIVGLGVNMNEFTDSAAELKLKMQHDVIHPIEQWLMAYRTIKERNVKCEELRLELDSRRRKGAQMQAAYEKLVVKGERKARDAANMLFKAQSEEDKSARLNMRYRELEHEIHQAVLSLIRDTAVLRDYAAAALVVMQRCFTQAIHAFDGAPEIELDRSIASSEYEYNQGHGYHHSYEHSQKFVTGIETNANVVLPGFAQPTASPIGASAVTTPQYAPASRVSESPISGLTPVNASTNTHNNSMASNLIVGNNELASPQSATSPHFNPSPLADGNAPQLRMSDSAMRDSAMGTKMVASDKIGTGIAEDHMESSTTTGRNGPTWYNDKQSRVAEGEEYVDDVNQEDDEVAVQQPRKDSNPFLGKMIKKSQEVEADVMEPKRALDRIAA